MVQGSVCCQVKSPLFLSLNIVGLCFFCLWLQSTPMVSQYPWFDDQAGERFSFCWNWEKWCCCEVSFSPQSFYICLLFFCHFNPWFDNRAVWLSGFGFVATERMVSFKVLLWSFLLEVQSLTYVMLSDLWFLDFDSFFFPLWNKANHLNLGLQFSLGVMLQPVHQYAVAVLYLTQCWWRFSYSGLCWQSLNSCPYQWIML